MLTTVGITHFHRNLEMYYSHIADELLDDNGCNDSPFSRFWATCSQAAKN